MPAKLDFLKDLREHLHSTGGEAAARVDVPEATVLEAYRRSRRQGLIEGDGGRPEKFALTDAGLQQLRVLIAEPNPTPTPVPKLEERFAELQEQVRDTAENVKGLFSLVDRILAAKREQPATASLSDTEEQLRAENEELEGEKQRLEKELVHRSRVIEFYATQIYLSDVSGREEMFKARGKEPAGELGSETAETVWSMVGLEEKLDEERNRYFGPDEAKVRKLLGEIVALREKLGFFALEFKDQDAEGEAAL